MKKIYLALSILSTLFLNVSMGYTATQTPAKDITVNVAPFNKNLNGTDINVQLALQTLDQLSISGSSPVGATGNIQVKGNGNAFAAYPGSTCSGQVVSGINASGVVSCVNYLTLTGLSATAPITYNNTTGAIGWTNSNAYIALTSLSSSNPITYNNSTGAIGWTNSNGYISLGNLSGTAPITYNNSTGAIGFSNPGYITLNSLSSSMSGLTYNSGTGVFSLTSGFYFPNTVDQSNWNGKQTALSFANSVQNSSGTVTLVGDASAPGASEYYGTNTGGTKGYYALPSNAVYPAAGIANSTGSAWGTSYSTTGSSGAVVLSNGPTIVAPNIGAATATTINKVTITQPASSATLTIANGKTFTINNTLTINSTDGITETTPSTSFTTARTDASNTFTGHQTIEGVTSTGATGTGNFVFSTSPTLTTPVLGAATGISLNLSGLTASSPVLTDASKNLISGQFSGNSTKMVSTTGSLITSDCVKIDANGNFIDSGAPCGSTSPGGPSGAVQVASSGSFAGSSNFVVNGTNVGIGTTLPAFLLDVVGIGRFTNLIDTGLTASRPVLTNSSKQLITGSFSGNTTIFATTNGTLISGDCVNIDANGNLTDAGAACGSGGSSQWTTTGSNIYFSTGNVGIGTSSALTQALTVQGNIATQGTAAGAQRFYEQPANGVNYISIGAPNTLSGNYIITLPATDGTNGQCIQTNGSGVWTFGTCGSGGGSGTVSSATANQISIYAATGTTVSGNANFVFDGTNLGIGTSTPSNKLQVNTSGTSEFSVNSSGAVIANSSITSGSTGQSNTAYGLVTNSGQNSTASGGNSKIEGISPFFLDYVSDTGHFQSSGTAPSAGTCGTSPSVTSLSTDNAGSITVGTGATTTSCAVNFAKTWANAPNCVVADDTNILTLKPSTSTTVLTITSTTTMSSVSVGDKLTWICEGNE